MVNASTTTRPILYNPGTISNSQHLYKYRVVIKFSLPVSSTQYSTSSRKFHLESNYWEFAYVVLRLSRWSSPYDGSCLYRLWLTTASTCLPTFFATYPSPKYRGAWLKCLFLAQCNRAYKSVESTLTKENTNNGLSTHGYLCDGSLVNSRRQIHVGVLRPTIDDEIHIQNEGEQPK